MIELKPINKIEDYIFTIRGHQVILDSDLAQMYNVNTSRLNEQVKRNINRFPNDFMFQLTANEWKILISQNAMSSWGGRRKLPYVFTEQGIASLSSILKSEVAVIVSIAIMRTFVHMRKFISINTSLFHRVERIEDKQYEIDNKFEEVFNAIEKNNDLPPKQGIFFDGQIFDAYTFVADLIRLAKHSIVIIDNYVDDTVLTHFSKRRENVNCVIYTKTISKQLKLDIEKHNAQYQSIQIKQFNKSHDRFLIIDDETVYHFGASLKDLGKKWFAFSKMDTQSVKSILDSL